MYSHDGSTSNIMSLMTSKLSSRKALYFSLVRLTLQINYFVRVVFSALRKKNSLINSKGIISDIMAPRFSPVSTSAGSYLGRTNKMQSVSEQRARSCNLSKYEYKCRRAPAVTYAPMTSFYDVNTVSPTPPWNATIPRLRRRWRNQVRDHDMRRRQKPLESVGIRDHLGFCPVISFRQFAPLGIEAEFC